MVTFAPMMTNPSPVTSNPSRMMLWMALSVVLDEFGTEPGCVYASITVLSHMIGGSGVAGTMVQRPPPEILNVMVVPDTNACST